MLSDFLHVAVLCSKRAPGLQALLHHPFRGVLYEIDCLMTSEPAFSECGVPVITHPIRSFYDNHRAPLIDFGVRELYDRFTAEVLRCLGIDAVVMMGYLYVATDGLLTAFPNRVLNVHDGTSKYPGLHATRDAVLAGEHETRSTVHLATGDLDAGPVVVLSDPFPVAPFVQQANAAGHADIVRAYTYAHREWMMRSAWGDLAARALERVASLEEAAV